VAEGAVRGVGVHLQQAAGNRAVARMVAVAQRSLRVGHADDPLEREADAAALDVVRALRSPAPGAQRATTVRRLPVWRAAAGHDHDNGGTVAEVGLEGGELGAATEAALRTSQGGGRPLAPALQSDLGGAFGADLSAVRVHTGARAAALSDTMAARAFTVGRDVYFRDGMPDTASTGGMRLLAHELAHTVQQGASPVTRLPDED
jgi:hypothetical protein